MRNLLVLLCLVGGCGGGIAWHGPYTDVGASLVFDLTDPITPTVAAVGAMGTCASLGGEVAHASALQIVGQPIVPAIWALSTSGNMVAWNGTVNPPAAPPGAAYDVVCMRPHQP